MATSTQAPLSVTTSVFFAGREPSLKPAGDKQILNAFGNISGKKKRSGDGYDKSVNVELVFWEDVAHAALNLKHGDKIEVTAGYMRSTIDTYATDQLINKLAEKYTGSIEELRALVEIPKIELTVQDFKKPDSTPTNRTTNRF